MPINKDDLRQKIVMYSSMAPALLGMIPNSEKVQEIATKVVNLVQTEAFIDLVVTIVDMFTTEKKETI